MLFASNTSAWPATPIRYYELCTRVGGETLSAPCCMGDAKYSDVCMTR